MESLVIPAYIYKEAFNTAKYVSLRGLYGINRLTSGWEIPVVEAIVRKLTGNIYKFNAATELEILTLEDKIEIPKFYIDSYKELLTYYEALSKFVNLGFIDFLEKNALSFKVEYIYSTSCILYIFGPFNHDFISLKLNYNTGNRIFTSNIYFLTAKKYAESVDEFEKDLVGYIKENIINA